MKNYRRYPGYKDSGIEWLGEIPAHWDTRRLRYAAQLNHSGHKIMEILKELRG